MVASAVRTETEGWMRTWIVEEAPQVPDVVAILVDNMAFRLASAFTRCGATVR
jgi:hypothetical protein